MSKAPAAPRRGNLLWLQGLACGAMIALVPALTLLMAVLLAPGLVALVLDREPGHPVARSVLLCGSAACVGPIAQLWSNGQTIDACLAMLGEIGNVGSAWSSAAAGWLLAELLPIVARAALEAVSVTRAARLRAMRDRLIEAWGPDPPPGQ